MELVHGFQTVRRLCAEINLNRVTEIELRSIENNSWESEKVHLKPFPIKVIDFYWIMKRVRRR